MSGIRRNVSLVFIFMCLTSFAAASAAALKATPARGHHRLDQVYHVHRHNTYEKGRSITDGFAEGLRAVEIDIVDHTDWEKHPNGPFVAHDSGDTGNKNCSGNPDRLGHCLQDLKQWLRDHTGSGPILAFIDMKARGNPAAWKADEVYLLDQKIVSILGANHLYSGHDLMIHVTGKADVAGASKLRQFVSQKGWPTLRAIGDKIIILYTGGRPGQANQTQANGLNYIISKTKRLPYGFFCPDVESQPHEVTPGGQVDGISRALSQMMVCSNLKSRDHYQVTANRASRHKQLIHLWGDHVYGNGSLVYNYIAIAHGISAIGRDSNITATWKNTLPLRGVRRSVPGYFTLSPTRARGMCMDVQGSGGKNGTDLHLWTCHNGGNQRFVYTAEGQLRPKHANTQCVDIEGGKAKNGKQIHLWDCDGGTSEKWELATDGTFRSRTDRSYCLAVDGASKGSKFKLRQCNSTAGKEFDVVRVPEWEQAKF